MRGCPWSVQDLRDEEAESEGAQETDRGVSRDLVGDPLARVLRGVLAGPHQGLRQVGQVAAENGQVLLEPPHVVLELAGVAGVLLAGSARRLLASFAAE